VFFLSIHHHHHHHLFPILIEAPTWHPRHLMVRGGTGNRCGE
jgi:hypothetical protein